MAKIEIKLSQGILNADGQFYPSTSADNGELGSVFDNIAEVGHDIGTSYFYYSSWSFVGSTLRLNFADGAYKIFYGVTREDPNALSGTATATGYEFYKAGIVTVADTGLQNLNYSMQGGNISISDGDSFITAGGLTTLLPSNSPNYPAVTGNVAIRFDGNLHELSNGDISGTITRLTETADKLVLSGVVEGNFQLSGNTIAIGNGLAQTNVSGNMTAYKADYRDGSHIYLTDISTFLGTKQQIDESLLTDASRFAGDDTISIDLPTNLIESFVMQAGAGNDTISLAGGGGRLGVNAGAGNDAIRLVSGNHVVDGGSGVDTVQYTDARSQYQVSQIGGAVSVSQAGGAGADTLSNVERVAFADSAVAFDIAGNAGKAYRIYQAAFDRKPDVGGLSFWISVLDKGYQLAEVAGGFVDSAEFAGLYGNHASNADFLTKLYANVLHRLPDQGGFDFWMGTFDRGATRATILADFSESAENQAQVIGVIGQGIAYTPVI